MVLRFSLVIFICIHDLRMLTSPSVDIIESDKGLLRLLMQRSGVRNKENP